MTQAARKPPTNAKTTIHVGFHDDETGALCDWHFPLAHDLEVTGHPLVNLTLRCDQTDGTLFAYLEDVDARGRVGYVSEGALRASMRRVRPSSESPYALTVPYHSFARADAEPLVPGQATELVFDLQPISHRFRRGHRIRLALELPEDWRAAAEQFRAYIAEQTLATELALGAPPADGGFSSHAAEMSGESLRVALRRVG